MPSFVTRVGQWLRANLLFLLILGILAVPAWWRSRDAAPAWVRHLNPTRLAWTDSLEEEWVNLIVCTGLRTPRPAALTIWVLPANTAPTYVDPARSLDRWVGVYDHASRAIVVRGDGTPAQRRATLRHEFVHAALEQTDSTHGPVFQQYATVCGLNPTHTVEAR